MLKSLFKLTGSYSEDKEEEKYILMTYRSQIIKVLPSTYYDSDSGWGCMLRVGQMAIANYLYLYEAVPIKSILSLFWDNSDNPFSIQQFTRVTNKLYPQKKQFQWYNPCQMGFIIKELLQRNCPDIHIKIFLDNCMFLSQIPTNSLKLLIIVMIRIGLQEPEEIYLPTVESLMQNKFFFAALGGTPNHAHLFLKTRKNQIGYLDPHKTIKAASTHQQLMQRQSDYWSKLQWIKSTKIDSSMGLIFRINKADIEQFWKDLQAIKQKHKNHFFIYMERVRPELEQGGLIEIDIDDFQ